MQAEVKVALSLLGSACQVIAYAIEAGALPFPAFVLGYAINGFGMALQVSCTSSMDSTDRMDPEIRTHNRMVLWPASRITPR